jgi:hypothetical protein
MRRSSLFLLVASLACWLVPAGPTVAQVNDFDVEGWTPGVALWGGMLFNEIDASLATGDVLGPGVDIGMPTQPIQPPGSGEDLEPVPFIGTSIELMSPPLVEASKARPRLFMHADFSLNFAQEDDITREANAGPQLSIPQALVDRGATQLPASVLLGQGTRASAKIEPLSYGAGLGAAFEVQIFDQIIRIKPSIEYFSFEVEASGIVSRGVATVAVVPGGRDPDDISDFRHILLESRRSKRFHGLGPGIEIETDAARVGSLVTSVFLSARAYSMLGNLEIRENVFNTSDPDPLAQQENARFETEIDRWLYRGSVGVRLRWAPKR